MSKKKRKVLTPEERPDLKFPLPPWTLVEGTDGVRYKIQDGVEQYQEYVESLRASGRKSVRDEDV